MMQCYNCDSPRLTYDKARDAYVCLDCGYVYPKQYFFISHSHLDIEKVRVIRDIIEETFFYEPILFFLKCLSDEIEIKDLIRREINERVWFVYCNSRHAAESEYVQMERNYISELIGKGAYKHLLEVDLDEFDIWDERCIEYIRKQVAYQIRKTKIFLSYAHSDEPLVAKIREFLLDRGYSVWDDMDLPASSDWSIYVGSKIREHSYRDGLVLSILSEAANDSMAASMENKYARDNGAMIVTIAIKGTPSERALRESEECYFILDPDALEESLEAMIAYFKDSI